MFIYLMILLSTVKKNWIFYGWFVLCKWEIKV